MRQTVRFGVTCALALGVGLAASACGSESNAAPPPAQPPTVNLAAQNVVTIQVGKLSSGPVISGQLTPAREASVRAEVGGSLVSLTVDRGDAVSAGAQIARVSSRDLESARASAEAAVKSADTALSVAKSEAQRTDALVKGGALAARDLEQANNAVSMSQAQSAAAVARLRSVEQQLADTIIKAPFAGVVSERPASVGDGVAPGTPILTIIDPSSMRLEAQVPSDQISQVKPGAKVQFTVRGMQGEFTGSVDRINPSADPVTRQVAIFISLRNTGGKLIAGLFAEGRVESASHDGLVAPLSALDETGPKPVVTRIREGKAEKVAVALGLRESNPEQVEITSGVAAGDVLIVGSAKNVAGGTAIAVVK